MSASSNVFDLACYILEKTGEITTLRLQKLVYFCQAHALVWDDKPIFSEAIEAWANGPVVRELFYEHQGRYSVRKGFFDHKGNSEYLSANHKSTVDIILGSYKNTSTQRLTNITHDDEVYIKARRGLGALDRGCRVMEIEDIAFYYDSLMANDEYWEEETKEEGDI